MLPVAVLEVSMIRGRGLFLGCIAAVVFAATSVSAHHSYAMYDASQTMTAKATIKEFHWGAPHSSVTVVVQGDDGEQKTLTLQGAAPITMSRMGFNPRDLRRGTVVEITWHPLRDGKPGGALKSIKFEDGRVFSDNEFGNPSPGTAAP